MCNCFQGDQLNDVFSDFPEVTVNFTLFGLMNNTENTVIGIEEDRLNRSLAYDAASLVRFAVDNLDDYTTPGARKTLVNTLKEVTAT